MIKANDLRLNNYFTDATGKRILICDRKTFRNILLTPENFSTHEYIPLTEEWLLKFGYIRQEKGIENKTLLPSGGDNGFDGAIEYKNKNGEIIFVTKEKFYYIIDQNDDDYGTNYTDKEIKYVHKLQNISYELTDEEPTLKELV